MATSPIHISKHPCVRAKLSQLRSESTSSQDTKRLVHEISLLVGCDALANGLGTQEAGTDKSPLGYEYSRQDITPSASRICLVPILRSGLSMVDALQTLLPQTVTVHHLGMYREKATLQPVEYYNNLPYQKSSSSGDENTNTNDRSGDAGGKGPMELAIIVDPIIATGSTVCAAIDTLRDWGVRRIVTVSVLASRGGLERAAEQWPEGVEMWVGGVDAETDERGMIKPGLGDIGDRLFLT